MERNVTSKLWGSIGFSLTILVLLSLVYLSWYVPVEEEVVEKLSADENTKWNGERSPLFSFSSNKKDTDLVKSLIDKLREKTRVAANGQKWNFTAEDAKEWKAKNPCQSRGEINQLYSQRKFAKDIPPNPLWEEVFREYTIYHRTCMRAVGNITDYFNSGNTSTGCQFVVADDAVMIGLGNKLQVIANSVFYGIITGRVVLVPIANFVPLHVCEPFEGSTWALDSLTFPTPPQSNQPKWELSDALFKRIDEYKESCGSNASCVVSPNLPYAAGDITNQKQPSQRFFCPTEQSFYSEITWTYLAGCLYTIAKTFAMPTFRPTLEAVFPDRVVLPRLFRTIILPGDAVWTRVKRIRNTYFQPSDRQVGIQMRYLYGKSQFKKIHELIEGRVLGCIVDNQILPELSDGQPNVTSSPQRFHVLITSLYLNMQEKLTRSYMTKATLNGDTVNIVQLTHDGQQTFGLDIDIQAFTEVLLLSLSDDLLIAPISTFGGTAQSYGALTPWFIEYRQNPPGLPSCARGLTVEPCNQYTGLNFDCRYDSEVGRKPFSEVVPYIEKCPQIEFPYRKRQEQGIQLRTTFMS